MQRASQKRQRGEGKADDETNQIEEFPVHAKPRLSPAGSCRPEDATPATGGRRVGASPEWRPSASGIGANLHAWPRSTEPGSRTDHCESAPPPGSATGPACLPERARLTTVQCESPQDHLRDIP